MEQLSIKDYLQLNIPQNTKKSKPTEYKFSLIFDNGSDFIIQRDTSRGIKRQLCFIANDNLLFIRDPKNKKDSPITSKTQIENFLSNDNSLKQIGEFKNKYFQCSYIDTFTSRLLNIHSNIYQTFRQLVKYGINPDDYIYTCGYNKNRELEQLNNLDFDKLMKIIKVCQNDKGLLDRKDGEYNKQLNTDFVTFLYSICDKFSIDYVRLFLDIYKNSDSLVEPYITDYVEDNLKIYYGWKRFDNLLDNYNLDFKRLCTYLFQDLYSQGIPKIDNRILELYEDTLNMQVNIYGKVKEKYPEHLKEFHDRVCLIFNLNQEYFKEQRVLKLKEHNKNLEFSNNKYTVFCAKTSQDLIEEGIRLHHCVGSYVNKVNRGDCSIFFLRKVDEPDISLITIEVIDDKILQVRGLCERYMNDEERNFFNKWIKEKELKLISE